MSDTTTTTTPVEEITELFEAKKTVKPNGTISIPVATFHEAMEKQGVSKEAMVRQAEALKVVTTAAAAISEKAVDAEFASMSKEDLANDEMRRAVRAKTVLPTHGGRTEVTVTGESVRPVLGSESGETKTTYGRTRVVIRTERIIEKSFHDEAAARIRARLGVAD